MQVILGQMSHLPIISISGNTEIAYYATEIIPIIRPQKCRFLFVIYGIVMNPCLLLYFYALSAVKNDVTEVFKGHQCFRVSNFRTNKDRVGKETIVILLSS